ncbi:MAG TPA: TatD family hydrolase, partial [Chthoniobacteraceae bacterium]
PQVYAVVGIHPNAAVEESAGFLTELRELVAQPKVVAIGECGLDYHRLPGTGNGGSVEGGDEAGKGEMLKRRQAEVFQQQLELAAEVGLNVVIHERDAWDDTTAILRQFTGRVRGVFHCFGKSPGQAREMIALGHLVSFTGIITFKNAPLPHASATELPVDTFMVETDCPFLAPVPHRGKRCEPGHTRLVAERIAALRGTSVEEIARATTATADRFFRFR